MELELVQKYSAMLAAANLQPDAPDENDYLWSERFPRINVPVAAGGWGFVLSIENQGSENSCTANALTSIIECIRRMRAGIIEQLSRKHLWWHSKAYEGTQTQNVGCTLRHALKASYKVGVVPESVYPYTTPDDQTPSAEVDALAFQQRTGMYVRCLTARDLREAIASNHMVYVGMMLEKDFYSYQGVDTEQYRGMLKEGADYIGNHAMFIPEFRTHSSTGKVEYYLINSWDKHWGDGNGGAWISEDVLLHDGFDFWVVTDFAGLKPYYAPEPIPAPAPAPAPEPQPAPPVPPVPSMGGSKMIWLAAAALIAALVAKLAGVI